MTGNSPGVEADASTFTVRPAVVNVACPVGGVGTVLAKVTLVAPPSRAVE